MNLNNRTETTCSVPLTLIPLVYQFPLGFPCLPIKPGPASHLLLQFLLPGHSLSTVTVSLFFDGSLAPGPFLWPQLTANNLTRFCGNPEPYDTKPFNFLSFLLNISLIFPLILSTSFFIPNQWHQYKRIFLTSFQVSALFSSLSFKAPDAKSALVVTRTIHPLILSCIRQCSWLPMARSPRTGWLPDSPKGPEIQLELHIQE